MSVLGGLCASDLATMFADCADAVTFTAPTGTPPAAVTPASGGIINRISMAMDLMTGEKVPAKRSHVTVMLSEIGAVADGWIVSGSDLKGAFTAYVDGDPMPDQSLGLVTVKLRT